MRVLRTAWLVGLFVSAASVSLAHATENIQGELVGEVTATSAILQSRLTEATPAKDGDVAGVPGVARFEWSESRSFAQSTKSDLLEVSRDSDYIIKHALVRLKPETHYFYRLWHGRDADNLRQGPTRTFSTLPGKRSSAPVSFVHTSCMNQRFYHFGGTREGTGPYTGHDVGLGFPALEVVRQLAPDFWILNGDNVYYDLTPADPARPDSRTIGEMRREWHQQFYMPRFTQAFAHIPTYWLKDDHDFRFNDADNTPGKDPSPELGRRVFVEQVPIIAPGDTNAKTYRTVRASQELQIWFLEGRDYRDPNLSEDVPGKSLWGAEQYQWLKDSLEKSDAEFFLIVSPTPVIGPDDYQLFATVNRKIDNHTNIGGYRHERDDFLSWAKARSLQEKMFIVTGDRHWQYHSVDKDGFEEFGSGAISDLSAREPARAGTPESTDPTGEITQHFTAPEPTGGLLHVSVDPGTGEEGSLLRVRWLDENGFEMYAIDRYSAKSQAVK